ncbi:hypothetical protein I2501_14730 [Streptacidiphilus sp. NEAU-YB345]|uniref:Uncharacterized protein n=1 Tax=Streptacidiphilus fuscans TaxID=2789292 RepID=A0A931B2Q4_9ACTN|nr:hypothetical protein [Streptacidiphilus fuscans]
MQPDSVDVELTLPRSAVVPGSGAAAVAVDADLAVGVVQGSDSSQTQWSGLTGPAANVGAGSGSEVTLGVSGRPPTVTAGEGGTVLFTAGTLSLDVTSAPASTSAGTGATPAKAPVPAASTLPAPAEASSAAAGTPSLSASAATSASASPSGTPSATVSAPGSTPGSPPASPPASTPPTGPVTTQVGCTLDPGQQGTIGAVPVVGGGVGRVGQLTVPGVDSHVSTCPPLPTGSLDPRQLPPVPPGALVHTFPEQEECAFAVGWANIGKQGEATAVNDPNQHPTLASLSTVRVVEVLPSKPNPYLELDSLGNLNLPPSQTTFLTFGFMPTSATLAFQSLSPLTVVTTGWSSLKQPSITTISGYQEMTISNVKVNGVPLDVGPDCRTSTPVHLELHGRADSYLPGGGDGLPDYVVTAGGPLYETGFYIPPFTGCGSNGQNYDSLFTAAVSGSDNSLYFEQGPACLPQAHYQCLPEIGLPSLPSATSSKPAITPKARR